MAVGMRNPTEMIREHPGEPKQMIARGEAQSSIPLQLAHSLRIQSPVISYPVSTSSLDYLKPAR